jgi:NitT/TauT family transport system substrate-binding protein
VVYSSADEPGLIYDMVVATPQSLAQRRADGVKFVKVWDKVVVYLADPKTRADGVKIMAARAGVSAKDYEQFMPGTHFLTLADGYKYLSSTSKGFDSILGSSVIADDFNVKNSVYKKARDVPAYIRRIGNGRRLEVQVGTAKPLPFILDMMNGILIKKQSILSILLNSVNFV